jgi:glucose-6-phosphate dehydrogenase assembly protein OpcA
LFVLAAARVFSNTPENVAIQAVHNFGACGVSRTPQGARELLASDYRAPDFQARMRAYLKGHARCMPFNGEIGSREVLFAGSLAEALLKADVKRSQLPQRIAFDPQRAVIAARSPAEEMALCTVFEAPQATARLFETQPATSEEDRAVSHIVDVLPRCLKKQTQLTLNTPALRSLLALAAYRIVTTPRKATP